MIRPALIRPALTRTSAIAATCGILGVAWVWIATSPIELPAISEAAKGSVQVPALSQFDELSIPPASSFLDIDARPIFSPTRRPLLPVTVTATAAPSATTPPTRPAPTPANLTLVGIMAGGEKRFALIRVAGSTTVATVAEGQELGGWRVHLILPDRVVLRSAATESEITFPQHGSPQHGLPTTVPAANRAPINLVPPAPQFSLKGPG